MFRSPERLRDQYEVVIIGGGGHGLAAAHYLAQEHGISDIAVLEQRYIGHGGTGRNTAIIRSNYLTEEGARFYQFSVDQYRDLAQKLDYNLFYSERGHFTLAHTPAALRTQRWRAEVNKHLWHRLRGRRPGVHQEDHPRDRPELRWAPAAHRRRTLPPAGSHCPPRRRGVGLRTRGRQQRR